MVCWKIYGNIGWRILRNSELKQPKLVIWKTRHEIYLMEIKINLDDFPLQGEIDRYIPT